MPERYSEAFIKCRVFSHAWDDDVTPLHIPDRFRHRWTEIARCLRCGTIRIFAIDSYGYVTDRHYEYPEGYQQAGEKLLRNDYRMAYHGKPRTRKIS